MTKQELIDYCLTYEDSYLDYPFDEEWACIRHFSNKKTFAFIYIREDRLRVNLKCTPMDGEFLRSAVPGVLPGYHMNKTHWITVDVLSAGTEETNRLIGESFRLTAPKRKKKPEV